MTNQTNQSRQNQQAILKEVARLTRENVRMRKALIEYAKSEQWTFYHTERCDIRWVTKLGPDLAMEALQPEEPGTLVIKKT